MYTLYYLQILNYVYIHVCTIVHVHVLNLSIHVGVYACSAINEVSESPATQNLFGDDELLYCGEYYIHCMYMYMYIVIKSTKIFLIKHVHVHLLR